MLKGDPLERLQPWMASELAVAPTTAKGVDFQVEWRDLPWRALAVLSTSWTHRHNTGACVAVKGSAGRSQLLVA